jgi:hypothetical protein
MSPTRTAGCGLLQAGCALLLSAGAQAYTEGARQIRAASFHIEGAFVTPIQCNGRGENGASLQIFQYTGRPRQPAFQVVATYDPGRPIGGRNYNTMAEAKASVARACRTSQKR